MDHVWDLLEPEPYLYKGVLTGENKPKNEFFCWENKLFEKAQKHSDSNSYQKLNKKIIFLLAQKYCFFLPVSQWQQTQICLIGNVSQILSCW